MTAQPPADDSFQASPPPSPVPGGTRPGELLDRFVARVVDGILLAIVYAVLAALLSPMFLSGLVNTWAEVFVYNVVMSVVFTALALAYFGYMESSRGQSVGKMIMKLRTIGPDGGNPTMEEAIRRNILYAANLLVILPLLGLFLSSAVSLAGAIMIALGINKDTVTRQGWHDRFAGGTRVLKIG